MAASDYPCPICGATSVPLFELIDRPPVNWGGRQSFGCATCLEAAGLEADVPFNPPSMDLTSTNHPY